MLSRSELRARLEDLETEGASGQAVEIETLRAIEPSARYWAERVRHPAPLRRLAKMFRCAGQQDQALALLQAGHAIDPLDLWTAVGLSAALDSAGQTTRALKILEPLLEQPQPKVAVLARAAVLARKLGDPQRCLAWRRQAAQQDPGQLAALISELTAAGHSAEALLQVRQAAASKPNDPELAFRCYVALRKFAPNDGQICRVVDWLTATAA